MATPYLPAASKANTKGTRKFNTDIEVWFDGRERYNLQNMADALNELGVKAHHTRPPGFDDIPDDADEEAFDATELPDDPAGLPSAEGAARRFLLPIGDVWYVRGTELLRIDEIKRGPGADATKQGNDFVDSLYSGHLDDQLRRMRHTKVQSMGLVVIGNVPDWDVHNQKAVITKAIRIQATTTEKPISYLQISMDALLPHTIFRTVEHLQRELEAAREEDTERPNVHIVLKEGRKQIDGKGLYHATLQYCRGITVDKVRQVVEVAPTLNDLYNLFEAWDEATEGGEDLPDRCVQLEGILNGPTRNLLREYLGMEPEAKRAKRRKTKK